MGFGIRTPTKKTSASDGTELKRTPVEKAGSSSRVPNSSNDLSVRRSIGEWEAGKAEPQLKISTPPKKVSEIEPQKTKPKTMPPQGSTIAGRKLTADVEAVSSSPTKYVDRLTEARACVVRAKTNLEKSRNTKNEIKTEVLQAVERLYQLVKEGNNVKGLGKPQTQTQNQIQMRKQEETTEPTKEIEKETTPSQNELIKKMEEHARLIKESNTKMENLQEAMERQKDILEKATYAAVASGQPRRQSSERTALHSVVVSSKDETATGEEVLTRIREAVNAKEGWVKVDKVRKAKDGKVIVGCRTEEERRKIKERLMTAETQLNVEEIKNKDPLLILRDVFLYNSDEDILSALRKQNGSIFQNLDKEDGRIEIRYKKKTKNPHTNHIILKVSPKVWNRMMEVEDVRIDLQRVKVLDQSPLVQCSMCLGYGHGRRFCKATVEKCSHCGGPHMKSDCADWLAGAAPSCCNCTSAKLYVVDHNAFSQECPVRRKWDALARATTAYC